RPHLEAQEDLGADLELAAVAAVYARALLLSGAPMDAVAACERALVPLERLGAMPYLVDCLITRGTAVGEMGRPVEARILLEGAIALADRHDLSHSSIRGRNNLASVFGPVDAPVALTATEEAFSLARRVGNRSMVLFLAGNLAWWYGQRAEFGQMEDLLADPLLEGAPEHHRAVWTLALATTALVRGESEVGRRLYDEATVLGKDDLDEAVINGLAYIEHAFVFYEDLEDSYDWALNMAKRDWMGGIYGWADAVTAALWTGDRARVSELVAVAQERYAQQLDRDIRLLRAVLGIEDADHLDEAKTIVGEWEQQGQPIDAIVARGGIARFLPQGHPERARLLTEAQRRCDELGLKGLRVVLDRYVT
ncbi:MAG TPA: hypothetical protein VIL12_05570, partial [Acidimicrobiia bacterium]